MGSESGSSVDVGRIINENGEVEYIVEKIVGKKLVNKKPHYLIKWFGWSERDNTWEPLKNLAHCLGLVEEFEENLANQDNSIGTIPAGGSAKKKAKGPQQSAKTSKTPSKAGVKATVSKQMKGKCSKTSQKTGKSSKFGAKAATPTKKTLNGLKVTGPKPLPVTEKDIEKELHELEIKGQIIYGPLFRLVLKDWEVPLAILGSAIDDDGFMLHLVRLKPKNEQEVDEAARNPCEGVTTKNVVIVCAHSLRKSFPDLVTKYYAENMAKIYNAKGKDTVAKEAAEALLVYNFSKFSTLNGKYANGCEKFEAITNGVNHEEARETKKKMKKVRDDFGLPEDCYPSDIEDFESSSSNDEFEEVFRPGVDETTRV